MGSPFSSRRRREGLADAMVVVESLEDLEDDALGTVLAERSGNIQSGWSRISTVVTVTFSVTARDGMAFSHLKLFATVLPAVAR